MTPAGTLPIDFDLNSRENCGMMPATLKLCTLMGWKEPLPVKFDDEGVLLCPICGFNHVFPGPVIDQDGLLLERKGIKYAINDHTNQGWSIQVLYFAGECNHQFELHFDFDSGQTRLYACITDSEAG